MEVKQRDLLNSKKEVKRVRFSDMSTVIVLRAKSASDIKATWLSKEEASEFKRNAKSTSKLYRDRHEAQAMRYIGRCIQTGEVQGNINLHDIEDIRGLEHLLSPQVYVVLMQRRIATINRVLDEQKQQAMLSVKAVDKIASISIENSEFAREWRTRIALL